MSAGTSIGDGGSAAYEEGVPWLDVVLSAIAAVSWALIGMAGTAALGLHLLGADTAGSLGPMTAAVVALGAGGSVTPSGDVSTFGLTGAEAHTAIDIAPLGVSLVGALLLSWFFLRSLRAAGVGVAPAELLARAGTVVALFVATLGGLAWAGHDVITVDGGSLGLDDLPGGDGGGGVGVPGLGDLGDLGGLLPDRLGDLVDAQAAVGFTVDTAATLLGGLVWSAAVLLIALLASRRTPLPPGWDVVHRVVRPAVSAVVTVLLVAVAAGFAAAAYAAVGDDHPKRIAGAALLGAPNGVWLGVDIGLFVPWDGHATGVLTRVLPDPLDDLLGTDTDQSVTLGRLAELDGRVWLLAVAAAAMMLLAGVLAAVRSPVGPVGAGATDSGSGVVRGEGATDPGSGVLRGAGAAGFVGRCAVRLAVVTALALPLLAWLADVSVDASLSVLGFDAFGAGVELHGHLGMASLLGAAWGAGAGAAGALLARATGAAGTWAASLALRDTAAGGEQVAPVPGPVGQRPDSQGPGRTAEGAGQLRGTDGLSGPYEPGAPYRPPNPATNPYLRMPEDRGKPQDTRTGDDDVYDAPTMVGPLEPPARPRRPSGPPRSGPPRSRRRSPDDGPMPPPPPPPPPPPDGPGGGR
ncbi:streptophobe family protein [Streptomyces phaeoluteigriseus]|uniref:Streptophobe family protein n=1 Tax=Streptomyces phaeoluteigriseus TaxID=114686 RepID=A0ABY4ZET7_9ACTN|nr:streptophobe family protein [Streptomyces phaeoluteigriseus]USQ87516.1 streptophobe family protein [Streptomyces phaeoluteigriseus]